MHAHRPLAVRRAALPCLALPPLLGAAPPSFVRALHWLSSPPLLCPACPHRFPPKNERASSRPAPRVCLVRRSNRLRSLPPFLFELHALATLDLSHNQLTAISIPDRAAWRETVCSDLLAGAAAEATMAAAGGPRVVGALCALRLLDLSHNAPLRRIEGGLWSLPALRSVLLAGCGLIGRCARACAPCCARALPCLPLRYSPVVLLMPCSNCN